jgi:DNA polymerase
MPWPASAQHPADFGHEGEDGERDSAFALATIHPSAVLRADDREAAFSGLVSDLKVAAAALIG